MKIQHSFETRKMVCFCKLFRRYKDAKKNSLISEIMHVPQTQNSKTDSLACNIRKQPFFYRSHGCISPRFGLKNAYESA